jgi:3-deoxy-7-phosphoheptulonate synthase
MIIPKEKEFTDTQLAELRKITEKFNVTIQPVPGMHLTIYLMKGEERHEVMLKRIEGLDYVKKVERILEPYKLMARTSEFSSNRVMISDTEIGNSLFVIAGHCTIDPRNPNFFLETAHAVKEMGAQALRGGVWKPRTSPHSYQGDNKALDTLIRAKEETGLPVNTEVMDEHQLDRALDVGVDILQVGARNALNYYLLKIIGNKTKNKKAAILLKRGLHQGPVDEFLLAAEYIVSSGNTNVILCPRGTLPKLDVYRNSPDESITPLLKEKTWAPVFVDPSHSVGKANYVPHTCLSAVAYGADGLNIECHVNPQRGIGDDPKQAITPPVLQQIIKDANKIFNMKIKYQEYVS